MQYCLLFSHRGLLSMSRPQLCTVRNNPSFSLLVLTYTQVVELHVQLRLCIQTSVRIQSLLFILLFIYFDYVPGSPNEFQTTLQCPITLILMLW